MEKNDPLIEQSIEILEQLNEYKDNVNTLNQKIAQ